MLWSRMLTPLLALLLAQLVFFQCPAIRIGEDEGKPEEADEPEEDLGMTKPRSKYDEDLKKGKKLKSGKDGDDRTDDEDRVDVKLVQAHDTAANTREVDAKDPMKVKGNADDDDEELGKKNSPSAKAAREAAKKAGDVTRKAILDSGGDNKSAEEAAKKVEEATKTAAQASCDDKKKEEECSGDRAFDHLVFKNDTLGCKAPWIPADQWDVDYITMAEKLNKRQKSDPSDDKVPDDMRMKSLLKKSGVFDKELEIKHILFLTYYVQEVLLMTSVMKEANKDFRFIDQKLEDELGGLATVSSGMYEGLKVTVVQMSSGDFIPGRRYAGYAQVSAVCGYLGALKDTKSKNFGDVDLIIGFGLAGGYLEDAEGKENGVKVGDAVVASGSVFTSRLHAADQKSFNWALYGGPVLRADKMVKSMNKLIAESTDQELSQSMHMRSGVISSSISYGLTPEQDLINGQVNVVAVDMETALMAQPLAQLEIHHMSVRVISNGLHFFDKRKQAEEFVENRETVSKACLNTLWKIVKFLAPEQDFGGKGFKTVSDLSDGSSESDDEIRREPGGGT